MGLRSSLGLLLLASALLGTGAAASGPRWGVEAGGSIWRCSGKPVGPIPASALDVLGTVNPSKEDRMALAIETGNVVFQHIRDTQVRYEWYRGSILPPDGNLNGLFTWPDSLAVELMLGSGEGIRLVEAVGMRCAEDRFKTCDVVWLWPKGPYQVYYESVYVDDVDDCVVWFAFPQGFDPREVRDFQLVRK